MRGRDRRRRTADPWLALAQMPGRRTERTRGLLEWRIRKGDTREGEAPAEPWSNRFFRGSQLGRSLALPTFSGSRLLLAGGRRRGQAFEVALDHLGIFLAEAV